MLTQNPAAQIECREVIPGPDISPWMSELIKSPQRVLKITQNLNSTRGLWVSMIGQYTAKSSPSPEALILDAKAGFHKENVSYN